jgi:signal transduction histidine kinase
LHNLYTIKPFFKINYIVATLLSIALAAVTIYYSSHEKPLQQTDPKLLKDYSFVSDPGSLKKALQGLDTSSLEYLDGLIQLKYNVMTSYKDYNNSYFDQIDRLMTLHESQSRKNIVSLMKIRTAIVQNKWQASDNLLLLIPEFEANGDTSALLLSYRILYDTQNSYNENYGDKKLVDLYISRIMKLSSHASDPYDKTSYYIFYNRVNGERRDKKGESELLSNYTKLIAMIDAHKELEFLRQSCLMIMVSHYGIRGQYDVSNQFALQALNAPVKNVDPLLLHCIAINYYSGRQYDSALVYINKTLRCIKPGNVNNTDFWYHVYTDKLNILTSLEDTPHADFVRAYFSKDSMNTIMNNIRRDYAIFDLQEKYHAEEKEKEILRQHNEKKILLFVSACVMLALILVMVLLWINRKVRKELQQEISTKEDILSVISHDLLSPLLALENTIQQTQKLPAGDSETWQQNLKKQQLYVQNMKSLSENLINWLWHDKSKRTAPASVKQVISDVRDGLDIFFEVHKCHVTIPDISTARHTLYGNALKVVLRNVLTNTIRHSKATNMLIECTASGNTTVISIYDNGEQQDDAFQTDLSNFINSQSPETHFSGLGLYLTQKFIRQLKGTYSIRNSDRPGYQTLQIITF